MSLNRLVCKNCGDGRPSFKEKAVCRKCGGECEKASAAPTSRTVEVIDNGLMNKRVEILKDYKALSKERKDKEMANVVNPYEFDPGD